ncbi:MAG: hypothetical protein MUE85_22550 [Microscillaceae bacterium]|nr:hypothetical protein [Microscillaceae bacterium]
MLKIIRTIIGQFRHQQLVEKVVGLEIVELKTQYFPEILPTIFSKNLFCKSLISNYLQVLTFRQKPRFLGAKTSNGVN